MKYKIKKIISDIVDLTIKNKLQENEKLEGVLNKKQLEILEQIITVSEFRDIQKTNTHLIVYLNENEDILFNGEKSDYLSLGIISKKNKEIRLYLIMKDKFKNLK